LYYKIDLAETDSNWLEITFDSPNQVTLKNTLPFDSKEFKNSFDWKIRSGNYSRSLVKLRNEFELLWNSFSKRVSINARYYENRVLFTISELLKQQWAAIAIPDENGRAKSDKDIWNLLVTKVCKLMVGDYAVLYKYHPKTDSLIFVSDYLSNNISDDNWSYNISKFKKATQNLRIRNRSIIYRSFVSHKAKFVRFYDTITDESVPKGETLATFYTNRTEVKRISSIAVPLIIGGRAIGVLQVGAFDGFRFRWANLQLLKQIANIVSPFLFQLQFVECLTEMTKVVFETRNLRSKYNDLCKTLCKLFNCHGSSLWLRDEEVHTKYKCCGAFNHEYLKLKIKKNVIAHDLQDETEFSSLVIKNNKEWDQIRIRTITRKNTKWSINKSYIKYLIDKGFKILVAFPIKGRGGTIIGTVSLYSKVTNQFSKDWDSHFIFTSQFLALLLETMNSQLRWKKGVYNSIVHQLKGHVTSIFDRADAMRGMLHRVKYLDREARERLNSLSFGLDKSNQDAREIMGIMSTYVADETLEESATIQKLLTNLDPNLVGHYQISSKKLDTTRYYTP